MSGQESCIEEAPTEEPRRDYLCSDQDTLSSEAVFSVFAKSRFEIAYEPIDPLRITSVAPVIPPIEIRLFFVDMNLSKVIGTNSLQHRFRHRKVSEHNKPQIPIEFENTVEVIEPRAFFVTHRRPSLCFAAHREKGLCIH